MVIIKIFNDLGKQIRQVIFEILMFGSAVNKTGSRHMSKWRKGMYNLLLYFSVGEILTKYRSGKLPKAFKIIPSLENWEEILYCTEPDNWTPAAMYQASRIFVSNLNAKMAQR